MKILFSDTHSFEKRTFDSVNKMFGFDIEYCDYRVTSRTAKGLESANALCSFVGDQLDSECLSILKDKGIRLVALRSAGFNHVDLRAAAELGLTVCRVPGYSPYAVAEFALGLLLTLNRKIHKSYNRVRELNFCLDGLVGFDLHNKTVGVVGCGRIGKIFAQTMAAIGCKVLVNDLLIDNELKANPAISFEDFDSICRNSDVISLHVPLNKDTFHLIDNVAIAKMKPTVLLVNTGRGALIETKALINALKTNRIGGAALDVYEEEENIFFHDLSTEGIQDDVLARLLTFPNVLITSHQAFLTNEALTNIAQTTLENVESFFSNGSVPKGNQVST